MSIEQRIIAQNEAIECFGGDTPYLVTKMLFDEAQELLEAVETAFVTDDLTAIASELSDVYYLLVRLSDLLGIDFREAVEIKLSRNELKYKGFADQEKAREVWKQLGGDAPFFEEYVKGND